MTTNPGSVRRVLFFLLKIVLAGAVLGILFTRIPPEDVLTAFRSASLPMLSAAFLLIPVHLFLRVARWNVLLNASGARGTLSTAAPAVLVGYAFSAVTPAEVGDYLARARMNSHADVPTTLALTLVDKAVHTILVLLIGFPALLSLLMQSAVAGTLSIVAGIALIVAAGLLRRRVLSFGAVKRVARALRFDAGLRAMYDLSGRTLLRVAAFGAGVLLTYVVQEYLLLNALAEISLVQTWQGFWAGMTVRSIVPFFFGDLGIREATHVYFFGLLGVDAVVALSASLLMFALNVLLPTAFGLVVFLRNKGHR